MKIKLLMTLYIILGISSLANGDDTQYQFADPIAHKTDFLTPGLNQEWNVCHTRNRPAINAAEESKCRCYTHLYAALSDLGRKQCRDFLLKRNYTHIYIYIYNENDYRGPSFNFTRNLDVYVERLKELLNDGLTPIVWLVPDDAPILHRQPVENIKAMFSRVVPKIAPYVGSFVLGLELNEYWSSRTVDPLGRHLRSLTNKKIGVHFTSGQVKYMDRPWTDYLMFQYGFGKTAEEITEITLSLPNRTFGKPFVAAEYSLYSEETSLNLGKAAMEAGAYGFGNGAPQ